MPLDFTALYTLAGAEAPPPVPVRPSVSDVEREELERRAAIGYDALKRFQAATKTAEQGKTSILKGIRNGSDVYTLLFTAVKVIAAVTDDTAFKTQVDEDLRLIHGRAYGAIPILTQELESVRDRLGRLQNALNEGKAYTPSERNNLLAAIRAHQENIQRIEAKLAQS